jgi:hypothetical protein
LVFRQSAWRECDVEKIKSGTLDEIYEVLRTRNRVARQLGAFAWWSSAPGSMAAAATPANAALSMIARWRWYGTMGNTVERVV